MHGETVKFAGQYLNPSCCFDRLFFIAEVMRLAPWKERKKEATVIDLTLSDTEDDDAEV